LSNPLFLEENEWIGGSSDMNADASTGDEHKLPLK